MMSIICVFCLTSFVLKICPEHMFGREPQIFIKMPAGLGSGNTLYYIITGVAMLLSRFAGSMLQKKFSKYSASRISMSGAEVAQRMLRDFGLTDVKITHVQGQLTDHYNPVNKTVNLSEVVYSQRNVSAAAVAAHECGHAVQHAKAYGALKMRSALVPLVNISSKFMPYVLMAGLAVAATCHY